MRKLVFAVVLSLPSLALTGPVFAHDLVDSNGRPVTNHTHVWRQQAYGKDYRQGHSVNNQLGSIIIWSPNSYQGYKAGANVRFARPSPLTAQPKVDANIPQIKSASRAAYGRDKD